MTNPTDELRARLLAEAEASIERMLGDERMGKQMTISEIEGVIGELEIDFRERVLKEVLGEQEQKPIRCPECGSKMRNKGQRRRHVVTLRGETKVERSYYQCEACGQGVFPPR